MRAVSLFEWAQKIDPVIDHDLCQQCQPGDGAEALPGSIDHGLEFSIIVQIEFHFP